MPPDLPFPIEFPAMNAVLTVNREKVTITRRSPVGPSRGPLRVREVSLAAIRAVELKRPGMTPGYLRLCTGAPLREGEDLAYLTGGRYDEDTLVLLRKHYVAFERARAILEELIAERSHDSDGRFSAPSARLSAYPRS